jgi:hypothetical protein
LSHVRDADANCGALMSATVIWAVMGLVRRPDLPQVTEVDR